MTRLNLIDPVALTNKHLVAEYKELTQVIYPMQRAATKGTNNVDIPVAFTLNAGHVKFFYNKGLYLHKRLIALKDEMSAREIRVDIEGFQNRLRKIRESFPKEWYNDWQPTAVDYKIIIYRIAKRIIQKPESYPDKNRFFLFVANMQEIQ